MTDIGFTASETTETAAPEAANSEIGTLARGAGVVLFGRFAGRGLDVLSQALLARIFGPAVFGAYALGWTFLRIASLVTPLGLDNAIIHFGAKYVDSDRRALGVVFRESLAMALVAGFVVAAGLYASAHWLATSFFGKPELAGVLRGFAPACLLVAGLRVAAAGTRISGRMTKGAIAEDIAQPALNILLIVVAIELGLGLSGAVAAGVASFAVGFALAGWYLWRSYRNVPLFTGGPALRGALLNYAVPSSLSGTFTMLVLWADRIFIGYMRPTSDIGIYQAASQFAATLGVIMSAFGMVFTPMISRLYHRNEIDKVGRLYAVSTKWTLYVSAPLIVVALVAPRMVMVGVYGRAFAVGALPLLVLTLGQAVNAGTGAVGRLLVMTDRQVPWLLTTIVSMVVNVALILTLVPRYGVMGAAAAASISVAAMFITGLVQVRRAIGIWPYDRRYVKGAIAAAITLLAVEIVSHIAVPSAVLHLALLLLVASAVFGGALLALRLDAEDLEVISIIARRLTRKRSALRASQTIAA